MGKGLLPRRACPRSDLDRLRIDRGLFGSSPEAIGWSLFGSFFVGKLYDDSRLKIDGALVNDSEHSSSHNETHRCDRI